jgi:hypothetical protein
MPYVVGNRPVGIQVTLGSQSEACSQRARAQPQVQQIVQ